VQPGRKLSSILLADDGTPVAKRAAGLATSLAKQLGAELHILQPVAKPRDASKTPSSLTDDQESGQAGPDEGPVVRFVDPGSLSTAILDHIERHGIELLVLGTQACMGLTRMIRRDMAERLLKGIPCSLLAVRLAGFVSSETLEPPEEAAGAA
jgi:nucleotide-binding universal stress UspA family protein